MTERQKFSRDFYEIQRRQWKGPFSIEELVFLKFFTPLMRIKNTQEDIQAQAREFPQIRNALRNILKKKPINPAKYNHCPRCRIQMRDSFYEGVAIKLCPRCEGKLIDSVLMDRVIARREIAFSDSLIKKAQEFKDRFMLNPVSTTKTDQGKTMNIFCPNCGTKMIPRPYNYYYIVPVDKCLSCHKIWFDSDELEILQILIEQH